MAVSDRLRGLATVITFASSYTFRRPVASIAGGLDALPWPVALGIAPAAVAWSVVRATAGLSVAIQIGLRVRDAPVLVPRHELLASPDELTPICSLVSDTHLTARGRSPSELDVDPGQWPFRDRPTTDVLIGAMRRVLAHVHRDGPRTVVWCGDEVDTGDPHEWARFRDAVASVPGLAHRLVPGNHDICFNAPFDDDHTLARRALRERAFQDHGPRLADYPDVDTIASDRGPVTVLLLDSCKHPSKHVLSNAIGRFGPVQLDEVARTLATRSGPVLCIAHHHVWRSRRFLQPDEWFNTAVDAGDLARVLLAYRRRGARNHVLVCHGHRHTLTMGRITDGTDAIDVVGLPSTTLGHKAKGVLDGVLRYSIAGLRADGTWGVAVVPVGRVVAPDQLSERRTLITNPDRDLVALSPAVPTIA